MPALPELDAGLLLTRLASANIDAASLRKMQAKAELATTENRISSIRAVLAQRGYKDETAAPGKSLRNPFLNDRALSFWTIDSIERWISRHHFDAATVHVEPGERPDKPHK
jgi:hypothetical protein